MEDIHNHDNNTIFLKENYSVMKHVKRLVLIFFTILIKKQLQIKKETTLP